MDVSEVKVLARRANGILFVAPVFILLSGFCLVYSILVMCDKIVPDKDILWVIYLFSCSSLRYKWRHFNRFWEYNYGYYAGIGEDLADSRFSHIYSGKIDSIWSYNNILWECVFSHGLYFLTFLILFLARLSTPKIIMEYDDHGLYIYRMGKPVLLLRYEEIWSAYSEEDFDNVEFSYHRGFHTRKNIKVGDPFWGTFKTGSIRIETPDDFICLGGIYHVKEVEKEIKRMVRKNRREFLDEMYENIEENQRERELEELAKHNPNT